MKAEREPAILGAKLDTARRQLAMFSAILKRFQASRSGRPSQQKDIDDIKTLRGVGAQADVQS